MFSSNTMFRTGLTIAAILVSIAASQDLRMRDAHSKREQAIHEIADEYENVKEYDEEYYNFEYSFLLAPDSALSEKGGGKCACGNTRFTLGMFKHHCRGCGALVCAKCATLPSDNTNSPYKGAWMCKKPSAKSVFGSRHFPGSWNRELGDMFLDRLDGDTKVHLKLNS